MLHALARNASIVMYDDLFRATRFDAKARRAWWEATDHMMDNAIEAARQHAATGSIIPFRILQPWRRGDDISGSFFLKVKEESRSSPRRGGDIVILDVQRRAYHTRQASSPFIVRAIRW